MTSPRWTVSIDAGGTFTDGIARSSSGEILESKVASTPEDPSRGLANAVLALAQRGLPLEDVSLICHGTTVATNATLTGNLARIALITTAGYRDVLGFRQSNRPDVYSLTPNRPTELVERTLRFELTERLDSHGRVLTPLNAEEVKTLIETLETAQPEAIAVSFLFSYLNDEHERAVGAALRDAFPNIPVTLSSEVAREFREYPRTATAAINAALRPLVEHYLQRADDAVQETGVRAPFLVMQSNGGSVPAERAGVEAHRLVLSGPAGGVAGLISLSHSLKTPHLISLDMGGTSTDVCLVRDGQMPFTTLQEIQDHTLLAPTVDIHTIGAGGGSIAWIDQTGRLKVGPQSAKAVPGPACYGRGGIEPTITDAHAVMGTLGGGELADGLELNRDLAVEAVRRIADPLNMAIEEGAEAILAIGLAHMVRALRKVSVERGLDPRDFALVPFGGAGPLHAGLLLRHMELKNAIIPIRPGLFSADGLLVAGLRVDRSQTVLKPADASAFAHLASWFESTSSEVRAQLIQDGVPEDRITEEATVDCRYRGQGFELNLGLTGWSLRDLEDIPEKFHRAHFERYGHSNDAEPVEIVTIRLACTGQIDRVTEEAMPVEQHPLDPRAEVATRTVHLPGYGEIPVAVIDRRFITAGATFEGPAIIQQMDATTVVLPEQSVEALSTLDLIITDHSRKAQ